MPEGQGTARKNERKRAGEGIPKTSWIMHRAKREAKTETIRHCPLLAIREHAVGSGKPARPGAASPDVTPRFPWPSFISTEDALIRRAFYRGSRPRYNPEWTRRPGLYCQAHARKAIVQSTVRRHPKTRPGTARKSGRAC